HMSPDELAGVAERAAAHDLERCLHMAVLLAHELLAAPIPPDLLLPASVDAAAGRSARAAVKTLSFFGRDGNPFDAPHFSTRLLLGEYRVRSDWGYRWAVLQRHALSHAYPFVRPVLRIAHSLRPGA